MNYWLCSTALEIDSVALYLPAPSQIIHQINPQGQSKPHQPPRSSFYFCISKLEKVMQFWALFPHSAVNDFSLFSPRTDVQHPSTPLCRRRSCFVWQSRTKVQRRRHLECPLLKPGILFLCFLHCLYWKWRGRAEVCGLLMSLVVPTSPSLIICVSW